MKVIVLGSTGFIGFPVAQALSRAGHIIYGQTRSQEKADSILAPEEIVPIVCDHASEDGKKIWGKLAETVDVVIDTVPATSPEVPLATFKLVQTISQARPEGLSPITFIYTGGSWVHARGTGGLETWTDERQPHSGNIKLTAWRWEVEKEVLKSNGVNGIVIRPSLLYGRSGSLMAIFFKLALEAAKKGESFEAFGYKDTRFAMIHADDLADLYVRVAERGGICKSQAFVGAASQSERFTDILDAVVRVSGAKGYTLRSPDEKNLFELAVGSTTNIKPTLGNALTGWNTRKMGVVDGMDIYWQAFKASLSTA